MKTGIFIMTALLFLFAGSHGMTAQDYSVTVPDGPVVRPDTLSIKPQPLFLLSVPSFQPVRQPDRLFAPYGVETKEQRAARINAQIYSAVTASVDNNLIWYRPPHLTKPWKQILGAARMFLSNPNGFPEGCVPLMNASFPFIYAKTPGMAPYDHPYSPDKFPQCIKSEYDFATGTYKQVMVNDGFVFVKPNP